MPNTHKITLSGRVQGVGFRPFIYNLAEKYRLNGTVCNNEKGVLIEVNASRKKARAFLESILLEAPKISLIRTYDLVETESHRYSDFQIIPSSTKAALDLPLTPDFAICDDCKQEIRDPRNRRFGYAFTTCTKCGPRYSITRKFPFERSHTSIEDFSMCAACTAEYVDPANRRFHSQTNSCPDCGMKMKLVNNQGNNLELSQREIIQKTSQLLQSGAIIAIKNTSGYLLCCDAQNENAIHELRERKKRPSKPFALLYPTLSELLREFKVNENEREALTSAIAPIVLLKSKNEAHKISDGVAPGLNHQGCMLPSSALLTLLMDTFKKPLVATSANIHGLPIIHKEDDATAKLSNVADYFLHHNLEVTFPQDDSVIRFAGNHQIILRRSRGMAPNYFFSQTSPKETILAMGAQLKSSLTYAPNSQTYVSPYLGNLDSYEVLQRFNNTLNQYQELFNAEAPDVVLIDDHPQYQSSILGEELAQENGAKILKVPHHEAHFGAVLGENGLFSSEDKILGVVWDGTGLGKDGNIWGGEFFSFEEGEIKRITHFDYSPWIAGDKMAKEPRLSLLSYLPEELRKHTLNKFSETERKVYLKALSQNQLKTSSVGRLFDAVSCLLGLIDISSYEGEAAMKLEALAQNDKSNQCIDFLNHEYFDTIPTKTLLQNMVDAIEESVPIETVANSFIHTLALIIIKLAIEKNFKIIACSGGVFQNRVLVEKLSRLCSEHEIELKLNRFLSCNDENISFGQLCCYRYLKK